MKQIIRNKSNGAFTLIEMIGVLAIVGILAAVVAPRVTEALRDGRVSSALATAQAVKSASDRYLDSFRVFPPDTTVAALTPEGQPYVRSYGDKASLVAGTTTFGDILLGQGKLEKMNIDIGNRSTNTLVPAPSANIGTDITDLASAGTFATVRAMTVSNAVAGGVFTPAKQRDLPHRVVFMHIPGLPLQEAVALKTKVDGPFPVTQIPAGNLDVVTKATATSTAAQIANEEPLRRGNCRLKLATGTIGQLNSTYDAYVYISHD
jgi:prepilin-type N-terminal cleavage/methylation domain-containing protein